MTLANKDQYYLTVVDVTGNLLKNEAATKADQRYQTISVVAPVGIFNTDATGHKPYVNSSWCKIIGLSEEEGLGNNRLKAVHQDDWEALMNGCQQAVKVKEISFSEYRFFRYHQLMKS